METTYQHLTDEDHIRNAEVARGQREPEEPQTVGRTQCPNPDCLNELDPTDKACNSCGTVISPDAQAAQDKLDEGVKESYKQTDPDDEETMEEIEAVEKALDDPDTVDNIMQNEDVMDKIADKVADKLSEE